jgi:hypothetical protein
LSRTGSLKSSAASADFGSETAAGLAVAEGFAAVVIGLPDAAVIDPDVEHVSAIDPGRADHASPAERPDLSQPGAEQYWGIQILGTEF